MSNIPRYDPSAIPSTSNSSDPLSLLNAKIAERQSKRKASALSPTEAGVLSASSNLITTTNEAAELGGWVPAAGESPIEREKRERKEKRALKLGLPMPSSYSQAPAQAPPSSYSAPPPRPPVNSYTYSAPPLTESGEVAEWKPAAGESPAEREKREKREKRQKLLAAIGSNTESSGTASGNLPATYQQQAQDESSYNGQQSNYENSYDQTNSAAASGAPSIHPSRLAQLPHGQRPKKEKDPNKEKTPARKKYLKRKKDRKAGKKAGEPSKKRIKLDGDGAVEGTEDGSGEEDGDSDEDDDDPSSVAASTTTKVVATPAPVPSAAPATPFDSLSNEEKQVVIQAKKLERTLARQAKKQLVRELKASGKEVPVEMKKPAPRVIAAPVPAVVVKTTEELSLEEQAKVAEELAREAKILEVRAARLEEKRSKRLNRKNPLPVDATPLTSATAMEVDSTSTPSTSSTPHLIPTGVELEVPPPQIPSHLHSADPVPSSSMLPAVPLEPLYRLPSATRPSAPSNQILTELGGRVHESVRRKMVVDPEGKGSLAFDEKKEEEDETVEVASAGKGGEKYGISQRGTKRLKEMGVTEVFAVQMAVLPLLLPVGIPRTLYSPFDPPRDLCVSAPTGSGKTLSYVIPIVETLSGRVVTRLRALVLLPTRDLVAQVRETFELFGKGTGLKIGTATGQHSFAHEQGSIVGEKGSNSLVDILITTPGRLVDHLRATKGFTLQHLRYLVIDEADRLLNQSFHEWLPSILEGLKPSTANLSADECLAPAWWDLEVGKVDSDFSEKCATSCQKLLFSATLSRDPAKIDALHLHQPIYVSVEDALDPNVEDMDVDEELKFTLPATLTEHMIVTPSTHKPLYLFHLLHTLSLTSALCFTKSVEASTRLAKLVNFFEEARSKADPVAKASVVSAYSSELPPSERLRILEKFKKGEIQMLICSDLISRGIDLPHVSHVISYDIPTDMRKYVHRVGRTARAGKTGNAWSLVENQEAAPFKAIMTSAQHLQKIGRVRVKDQMVEPFVPYYQVALDKLKAHFATGRKDQDEA